MTRRSTRYPRASPRSPASGANGTFDVTTMRLYVDAVRRATYPVTFALTRSGVPFPKAFNEARILVHDNAGKGL